MLVYLSLLPFFLVLCSELVASSGVGWVGHVCDYTFFHDDSIIGPWVGGRVFDLQESRGVRELENRESNIERKV